MNWSHAQSCRHFLSALFLACFAVTASAGTTGTALVRHAPSINGTVDGSVQQMSPESAALNGGATITADWLVPGTPTIQINGHPNYAGTVDGTGSPSPSGYRITLNGGTSLQHIIRRTDPVALPVVTAPPQPIGTRSVTINSPTDAVGSFSTLRDLTLTGNVGQFAIPGGTYGDFIANGGSGFTLGVAGSTEPMVYNFQHLALNGQANIVVVGPVVINIANGFAVNGSVGSSQNPAWLTLNVYSGALGLEGGCSMYGILNAPNSTVTVMGSASLTGSLAVDRLAVLGGGLVRLASFTNAPPAVTLTSPASNAIFGAPASVTLTADASDADGSIARVEFYASGVKIGDSTAAPYTLAWANVPAGAYVLTAVATDNAGAVSTSLAVPILVDAPPTVAITAPATDATFTAPAGVTIQATAADADGSVAKVEFYSGSSKLGESVAAPFEYAWTAVPPGAYTLTGVATDDRGFQTTSSPVSIVVNAPPTVSLKSPLPGQTFTAPATITIEADAGDGDGTIAQVDFYSGATKLGSVSSAPFQFAWNGVPAGSYNLTAVAIDNVGASTTSAPVSIQVLSPNQPPSVVLTAPANGSILTAPAAVTLAANASDSDGTIAKVEFFQGTLKVGESTSAPYSISLSGLAAGTYTFTAVATDNQGATAGSPAITVVSNAPPVIAIVSPVTGTTFAAPATILLTANSSDSDGSITKVEFFSGGTKLGETTTAPYQLNWTNVAAGTYSVTAVATDDRGASTTSTAVSVVSDLPPVVALSTPADQSVFDSPASIVITATSSDADGTVAKIEFYADGGKIGETSVAPYQFTWTGISPGAHVLTARAIDNGGITTDSAPIHVLVNVPPVAAITSPADGTIFTAPASFTVSADATDTDGTVVKVEFFQDSTKLGEATAAPYAWSIANLDAGNHVFTIRATDNTGSTTISPPVAIVVNAPPAVALTSPLAGAIFGAPATITLTADASDADGTVAKVEFYNGAAKIGESSTAPYQITTSALDVGNYTFTARATDNHGAITLSPPVNVVVETAPTVALTAPSDGAVISTGSDITLVAAATDADGSVAKVEFFNGTVKLGEATTAPYQFLWSGAASGAYTLTAVATDNQGVKTTSAPIAIAVDIPPTVTMTAPADGATFGAGAPISFAATAADADGSIAKVEFYQGSTKLGDGALNAGSYRFTLATGFPAGSYAVTAKATDNLAVATTSAAITVQVTAPLAPAITFNPPPGGAVLTAPAAVTLSVTATDPNGGTITKVDFYLGSTLVGTSTTADANSPSTFVFTSSTTYGPGTYVFSAVATNSAGLTTTTSTPLTITVLPALPYTADFETTENYVLGSLSGQLGWTVNQGDAQVTNTDASHGVQAVTLNANVPPTQIEQVFAAANNETVVFVDCFAKPVAAPTIDASSQFDIESSRFAFVLGGATAALQVFNGNGTGGGQWTSTAYSTPVGANGQTLSWIRLTARIDFTNKRWDLYANGQMVAADLAFRDSTRTYLSTFIVQGNANAPTLVDDLFAGATNPLFADVNNDGIDDAWEVAHGLSLAINDRNGDADGDGITNLQEYVNGTDPLDFYNGTLPVLTSLVVNNLPGSQGLVNVKVTRSSDGTPLANAPVTFTVASGYNQISTSVGGTLANTQSLLTDAQGIAQVYINGILYAPESITVVAKSGVQQRTLVLPLSAPLTDDSDGNGLPDWWEVRYFGHTGVDPNADPDSDGATNAQEYQRGTDPTVADLPSNDAAAALRIFTPLSR